MDGAVLTQLLCNGWMQEPQVAFVCREVLSALAYMHSFDRIHRDIKSDNILVTAHGHVKLGTYFFAMFLLC